MVQYHGQPVGVGSIFSPYMSTLLSDLKPKQKSFRFSYQHADGTIIFKKTKILFLRSIPGLTSSLQRFRLEIK